MCNNNTLLSLFATCLVVHVVSSRGLGVLVGVGRLDVDAAPKNTPS